MDIPGREDRWRSEPASSRCRGQRKGELAMAAGVAWQGTSLVNCGPSVLTAESYWVINSGNGELSLKVGDDIKSDFRHTAVQGGWQKWVARC